MRRNIASAAILVLPLMRSGSDARGDLPSEHTEQAEALIGQFSAREFAVRQKAVEELIKMGPDVLPRVRKHHYGSTVSCAG